MVLDEDLLGQARRADARYGQALRQAEQHKREFHRSVRRLHLTGGSLREIAEALRLSHQRVHQIVEASGGTVSWRARKRRPAEPACGFCGRSEPQVRRLIAGPGVHICTGCVRLAHRVVRRGERVESARTSLAPAPRTGPAGCSFCGRPARQVSRLVAGAGVRICADCLAQCDEILAADRLRS